MMNETLNGEPLGVRWRAGCEWVHPSALSPIGDGEGPGMFAQRFFLLRVGLGQDPGVVLEGCPPRALFV